MKSTTTLAAAKKRHKPLHCSCSPSARQRSSRTSKRQNRGRPRSCSSSRSNSCSSRSSCSRSSTSRSCQSSSSKSDDDSISSLQYTQRSCQDLRQSLRQRLRNTERLRQKGHRNRTKPSVARNSSSNAPPPSVQLPLPPPPRPQPLMSWVLQPQSAGPGQNVLSPTGIAGINRSLEGFLDIQQQQ